MGGVAARLAEAPLAEWARAELAGEAAAADCLAAAMFCGSSFRPGGP